MYAFTNLVTSRCWNYDRFGPCCAVLPVTILAIAVVSVVLGQVENA